MLLSSIFTFRLSLPSLHAYLKLILINTTERTLLICKPQNADSFFILYFILHSCHLCMQYESDRQWTVGGMWAHCLRLRLRLNTSTIKSETDLNICIKHFIILFCSPGTAFVMVQWVLCTSLRVLLWVKPTADGKWTHDPPSSFNQHWFRGKNRCVVWYSPPWNLNSYFHSPSHIHMACLQLCFMADFSN